MSAQKKTKFYHFHEEWELQYFFAMIKDKCCCLICDTSMSIPKKGNLERHFMSLHAKHHTDYPLDSEQRKNKLTKLKADLSSQQTLLIKPTLVAKAVTVASFKVSYLLAKKCKSFSDGELFKDILLEISDNLFNELSNQKDIKALINNLQLSRNSVVRRVEKLSLNLKEQLADDIDKCMCFSIQLDESTDISDTAQLLIFIRMVFDDFTVKEELFGMISLKEKTRGIDIFLAFKIFYY